MRFRDQLQFFRTAPWRVYGSPPRLLGIVPVRPVNERVFIGAGFFIAALVGAASNVARKLALTLALICKPPIYFQFFRFAYIQRKITYSRCSSSGLFLRKTACSPRPLPARARLFVGWCGKTSHCGVLRWIDAGKHSGAFTNTICTADAPRLFSLRKNKRSLPRIEHATGMRNSFFWPCSSGLRPGFMWRVDSCFMCRHFRRYDPLLGIFLSCFTCFLCNSFSNTTFPSHSRKCLALGAIGVIFQSKPPAVRSP